MNKQRILLWDLPTRVFHWSLVALVVASVISGKIGGNAIVWHGRCGLAIVGLLAFRLVWGLIGSTYARFLSFIPTPASLIAYLRGQWHGVGHNPLGAFSVFGLLCLLALQAGTGLFGNDDIAFRGPLAGLVSGELSDWLTGVHKLSINLLIALIVLHLAAITFYARVKKDNLVQPMVTGWKEVEAGRAESATGGGWRAFCVALLIALAAVYGASGAWWRPTPVTPPASAPTPAW